MAVVTSKVIVNTLLTTAVPAKAIFPAVVQVNAPVGIRVIVPPPSEIGVGAVIVTTAAVPDINVICFVGAIVAALAIVGAAALVALRPLSVTLVPVAAPIFGVTKVGLVAKTKAPDPVSPVTALARFALEGVAKKVATFAPSPEMPVDTGNPVQLVNVPLAGVPSAGATKVELVNNNALVSCFVVPD